MRTVLNILLEIPPDISLNQVILGTFAALLVIALVFLLIKKLNAINSEAEFELETIAMGTAKNIALPVINLNTPPSKAFSAPTAAPVPVAAPHTKPVQVSAPDTPPQPENKTAVSTPAPPEASPKAGGYSSNLDIILNALADVILAYNEDNKCLGIWYNNQTKPIPEFEKLKGKTVSESFDAATAKLIIDGIEFASANGQSATVQIPSFINKGGWLSLKIDALFEADHQFAGNVTILVTDITPQKRRENELTEQQLLLAEAQKLGRFGYWWYDINLKQTYWSDSLYALFEIDKLPAGTSHFDYYISRVEAADRRKVYQFFNNITAAQNNPAEHRVITSANNARCFKISRGHIEKDWLGNITRVHGIIQDISQHQTVEGVQNVNTPVNHNTDVQTTQHSTAEDVYKTVLESIKLAALSLDGEGKIIFCNDYLARLIGKEPQHIVGQRWFDHFVPDEFQKDFISWYKNHNIPNHYSNPIVLPDGSKRIISWQNTTIYDQDGRIIQTTSIGEDVTQQQKDKQALIQAKEAAERTSVFKSDFLSTMSHEIRTPMNAVIGNTNLLLEESPRADQLPYLNNLKFSGDNLLAIINDILDYNKIEAGKLELAKSAFNVFALAQNIKQAFEAKAAEKNLSLKLEVDKDLPKNIIGDPTRLSQILNNLISNAIKFTHKGGITILIREDQRSDNRITLSFTVADTGIGIDDQNLNKIFEPFVQEEHQRDYGGSGLGLAIIKRLVELHDSEIKVNSALGKGTQFNFSIAYEYSAEPVSKPKLNPVQKMQEGDLSGMKVLVVDDNKMNILIASRFLNKWNITISEANNGLEATQMVENNDYDLVIMDLQMPIMDGFEATRTIKQQHPKLPVIALTADAMPETYAKVRSHGMDDYLTKPFMPEILFEKVSRHYKPQLN